MKHLSISLVLIAVLVFVGASTAQARSLPHEKRSGSTKDLTSKLSPAVTNAAGDITIAPPVGWAVSQSESWAKSSDGLESYTEAVNVDSANGYASLSITAENTSMMSLEDIKDDLDAYYDGYKILAEGTTTVGTDVGYMIEAKNSYSHYKEIVVVKNGWKYDAYIYASPSDWKKYSTAMTASLATLRLNAVK